MSKIIEIEDDDDDDFKSRKLLLKILKLEEKIMSTIQEGVDAVTALAAVVNAQIAKEATFEADVTNTLNVLAQKIATLQAQVTAGSDTAPIISAIAPITQAVSDASALIDTADAAVKVAAQ